MKQWELQMSWAWRYDQQRLWICDSCVCVSERVSVLTLDFSIFCLKCDLIDPVFLLWVKGPFQDVAVVQEYSGGCY